VPASLSVSLALLAAILGALIGSFSNVLIYRLPRGESVVLPPSHCPHCNHRLSPLDLIPVLSWIFLGGRCRYCHAPISPRYPLVEAISAAGYLALAMLFPPWQVGFRLLGLWCLFTMLLVASSIDIDLQQIPDGISLPGIAIGLLFALGGRVNGLPSLPGFGGALRGALLGAGLLVLIGTLGAWVLRRLREPRHPEYPVGYMQIGLAGLVGAWLGPLVGLLVGVAAVGINLARRRVLRVPDWLTQGGLLLSVVLGADNLGPGLIKVVQGALQGAGAMAILAGLYWWTRPEVEGQEYDPVAMGFGDVKLAAMIGAFLGAESLLIAVAVAVFLGAVLGSLNRLMSGNRILPFGPYLAAGALAALLLGGVLAPWLTRVFA
jgi:leader peptidase (prepilin peptidase)/N-methyltransferase